MTVLGHTTTDSLAGIHPGAHEDISLVAGRIRRSERRLRSLIENATDLLVITDALGTPLYVSPSVRGIAGLDPADVLGAPQNQIHHPDDLQGVIAAFYKAVEDGRAEVEFRVRHSDGSWHWLELTMTNLLHDPDVAGLVLIGRDVTERKVAEEALRVSEERWRTLLLNSSDVITVLGGDGKVLYTSPSTERMLGYPPQDITEMDVFALVHPEDLERAAVILLDLVASDDVSVP